jgi:acetolactate synthase-1/2/3 large subunit
MEMPVSSAVSPAAETVSNSEGPGLRVQAGKLLVSILEAHGVDRVFCVAGESYLPIFDALYDGAIDVVVAHLEGSAGFMAIADTKLTGRIGACFVSRGPGATNASIAVHTAQQDAVPFLLFIGQVERRTLRRGAFQEIDYGKMFGDIAKWVSEVSDPERLAEVMARAIQVATSGTPGPVVIVLPEDMLAQEVTFPAIRTSKRPSTAPSREAVAEALALLNGARRPLVIAGGELGTAQGRRALAAFADAWELPVLVSFRRHDLFDNTDRHFAGDLGFHNTDAQMAALKEADLVLAVGTRLGDLTTHGYTFPESPWPQRKLIHVYDDPAVIGVHFRPDVGAACDSAAFLSELTAAPPRREARHRREWVDRLRQFRIDTATWEPRTARDGVVFGNVVVALAERLDDDAIVTLDAGISAALLYKHFPVRPPQRLIPTMAGVMGSGVPGAVAAALRHPERQVVCVLGDGDFLMTGNELALAVERKLPIKIILSNNRSYGSIRLQQEREYPGRNIGTDLSTPDFAALARAFGSEALVIACEDEVGPILDAALAASGPVLVEVKASLSAVLPPAT